MQKFFVNGKCYYLNDSMETFEAFFCNDESFVLCGRNDEVLSLKSEGDEVFDCSGKTIIPAFYDTDAHIFEMIENIIKTQKSDDFVEKEHENDENFEIFENFDLYKETFLSLQNEYIKNGITTIFEMNVTKKSFVFWKKLAQEKLIKIDIIGFVNITSSKDVMDNNCVSYRKYVNHFRLGGYSLSLDGKITNKSAWLKKKYKNEKCYSGCGLVLDERLNLLLKTALEEKKIVFVETNGSKALDQFLFIAEEFYKEKKTDDALPFLPVVRNVSFVSSWQLKKIKELGFAIDFDVSILKDEFHLLKSVVSLFGMEKLVPANKAKKLGIPIMFHLMSKSKVESPFELVKFLTSRVSNTKKIIGKGDRLTFDFALKSLITTPAKYCFESEQKGSIEQSKKANFLVLSSDLNSKNIQSNHIEKVFVNGECIFDEDK